MRVAIYVRVSTKKQTVDLQLADLNAVAMRSGWDVIAIYQVKDGTARAKTIDDGLCS